MCVSVYTVRVSIITIWHTFSKNQTANLLKSVSLVLARQTFLHLLTAKSCDEWWKVLISPKMLLKVSEVSVYASDNISVNKQKSRTCYRLEAQCVCQRPVCVCAWAYLQAFIVPAAAAVALLGHVLLQVEDGAETAEIPWRGNHKLLTCGGRPWERLITSSSFQKTKFKLKHGCMLVTCVSPRGLLGLKGGRMKSAGSHGDAERDCLASGPASSLLSLLSAEKNTRAR